MAYMKEWRKTRIIQIPVWMDTAISELAIKHNKDVESEIECLVKAAIEHAETGPTSMAALGECEKMLRRKQ
jgi:hypothetical protein